MRYLFNCALVLALSQISLSGLASTNSTPAGVADTLTAARIPASALSFVVLDTEDGHVVVSQSPDTPRSPASTLKTLTTFAALDFLGPAYTWHTHALIRGELNEGVLKGDLILKGGGDPYMTLERWWNFSHELRAKGLKRIEGDIIIDNTAFQLPAQDPGAFDGKPNRSYNVIPDALMVNFQSIQFRVAPNPLTRRVEVFTDPMLPNLSIDNQIRFAQGRCRRANARVDFEVVSDTWDQVRFTGALTATCPSRNFTRVLLRPASYAYGTFVSLWREQGGEISGKLRIEPTPIDARLFMNFDSLTLSEIVRLTNKFSSNLMARDLLLTQGEVRYGAPATVEKGINAITEWSQTRALSLKDVDIDNGSGLSRSTHISVQQMAAVLNAAYHSPYAPEFIASLPLAGVDGTLHSRMKGEPQGAVRLKTGHIDGVSGVAGYVTSPKGKTYILVSIVNHVRADYGAAEPVHAALVEWILGSL